MPALSMIQVLLTSLWTGGAIITGYIAVPVIFSTLSPNKYLAGTIAGNIFSLMSWIGIGIGIILLISFLVQNKNNMAVKVRSILVLSSTVLIALNHFVLTPMIIVARGLRHSGDQEAAIRFSWLHGGSSILFLCVTILSVWLLVHLLRNSPTR